MTDGAALALFWIIVALLGGMGGVCFVLGLRTPL